MAKRTVSQQTRERMSKAQSNRQLTLKQARFVKEYAKHANGTKAAKLAGYSDSSANALGVMAHDNLRKPNVVAAIEAASERIDYTNDRVLRRLDRLSHGAESVEQYGVAVRAEELIGRAAGMFVDRSLTINGTLSGDHLTALLDLARKRQEEPLDLAPSLPGRRVVE